MDREKELARKYAYNINQKQMKNIEGSGIDVESLKKGFYDEIYKEDNNIIQSRLLLKNMKKKLLKELIYTHKEVPKNWKSKLEYKKQIMNIVSKDENFLKYIGRGNIRSNSEKTKMIFPYDYNENINMEEKKKIKNKPTLSTLSDTFFSLSKESNIHLKNNNMNFSQNDESKDDTNNKTNTKFLSNKSVFKLKKISSNNIISLLQEHKTRFPILETFKKEITELNIKKKNNNDNEDFARTLSYIHTRRSNSNKDTFKNVNDLNIKEKNQIYRQGIFNKLIPHNINTNSFKMNNFKSKSSTDINNTKNEKINDIEYGALNTNKDFYKRIQITDPIKKKFLKKINFTGPYYPYCPSCVNKNLQFYEKLDRVNCLNIANFLKKSKSKKPKNIINN